MYRSPRLSPMNLNIDFGNSEFSFKNSHRPSKRGFAKGSGRHGSDRGDLGFFPETINEDMKEEETPVYVRHSRFREMRDYNEFGKEQKRYRSDDRGKRKKNNRHRTERMPQILTLPSTYVSENEEEDDSQSS